MTNEYAAAIKAKFEATQARLRGEDIHQAPKIITWHAYPPIPQRDMDWCAYYESHEEGPQGWGSTEAEAIQDLKDNYDMPE